jgi:hypothetical protein
MSTGELDRVVGLGTISGAISCIFHTIGASDYEILKRQQPKSRSIVIDFQAINMHTGRYVWTDASSVIAHTVQLKSLIASSIPDGNLGLSLIQCM